MKLGKILNESRADISRLTETKLYKELKKIVDKASTEAFNGKCKFVGAYDGHRAKRFYELVGATQSEVKKCNDIIKKEIEDLLSPFIDPLGGRIEFSIVDYNPDTKQQNDDILFCDIILSFNKESDGLPTFKFYFNTGWEIDCSFNNSSVGNFDDFEKFAKLLKVLNDFCEKFLK